MSNKVFGSGGGKSGGGGAPSEAPDSLQSRQRARVVEVISEGEIGGLVDGLKSVYLNDVPIQNADGSFNFTGVTLVANTGTPNQGYIPGFSEQEAVHNVGLALVQATPYIFSIPNRTSSGADAVRVTIGVPGLSFITEKGDINGTSVDIQIAVQHNGGGYVNKITDTISGKTTSAYQRDYRIELPQDQAGPWDVRVTRVTADSGSAKLTNPTRVNTYTVISETKMRYAHSAVVGLEINSEQFPSIPVRGYHSKGMLIQVPAAPFYDPVTRTYTGLWNGTFETKYSNNPAWVLYDLVTMDRYGLGSYVDASIVDKWALYSIAKYCDELVPDGLGGMEPRYTCNIYLQDRSDAFMLIANLASIAHTATYGSGGGLSFVQDAPRDPIALYTPANVIDGKFEYAGASIKAQHNVVLVSWNDPADMYRQKIEYVEDASHIAKYGIVQTEVVAMGCTSRGQARRMGKAIMYAEQYESESITFKAGFDTYKVYPGATFSVADPTRTQVRNGGRLLSATSTSIVLDSPVDITAGVAHTLKVVLPDGSVCARAVVSEGMGLTTIVVSTPFSYLVNEVAVEAAPVNLAMWALESADKLVETWVCMGAEEDEKTGNIAISGIAYHPEKFALIDSGEPLPPTPAYNPYLASPPPTALVATAYLSATGAGVDLLLSWVAAEGTRFTNVAWRRDNEEIETTKVYGNSLTLRNVSIGTYSFYVSTTNGISIASPSAELIYVVASVAILPDTTGLQLKQPFVDQFASFVWDALSTADSYRVQILVAGVVKREVTVTDNWYIYDYAESTADGAGAPFRAFDIRIKAKFGVMESGNWEALSVVNPAPPVPAATVLAITGGFQVSAPLPGDTDYAGMAVWASTITGFTPAAGNQVFDGANNSANIMGQTPGVPVYVRVAFYDVYGQTGLNVSSQYTVTPLANVADIPVVAALPTSGMTEGQVVYLLGDKKLYRYDGTAWVSSVTATDISGQLADSQIAAIAASKVSGQLTDAQVAAIAAAKITGTVSGTQIAASSITSGHIVAGTITASDIAAGTITASEIAAGTITAANIAAGTITSTQIAAGAIVAGSLAAGSVNAAAIISGAVTSDKITAASLSAISASLGIISSGNITLDATSSVMGGQSGYNTGNGFWMGYASGSYKFSLGNSVGNNLTWDGTNLNIVGGGTFSGALNAATGSFTGVLSAATGSFSGAVNVGDFTGYAWPAAGGTGAHLSASGLLLGNANASAGNPNGYYFQINTPAGGAPGIYTNIPAYLADAQVSTLKIAGNAVTVPVAVSSASTAFPGETMWTSVMSASIYSSGGFVYLAVVANISYTSTNYGTDTIEIRVVVDGSVVWTGGASGVVSMALSLAAGGHTATIQAYASSPPGLATAYLVNSSIFMLETKR